MKTSFDTRNFSPYRLDVHEFIQFDIMYKLFQKQRKRVKENRADFKDIFADIAPDQEKKMSAILNEFTRMDKERNEQWVLKLFYMYCSIVDIDI